MPEMKGSGRCYIDPVIGKLGYVNGQARLQLFQNSVGVF
jgi:hypothetical protein